MSVNGASTSSSVELSEKVVRDMLEVEQVSETRFDGRNVLKKPLPTTRGVYGGYLCGQAVLVAMKSVPEGFKPHSLHSYFINAAKDTSPCLYEVEKLTDGRNFASRLVRASQDGKVCYIVMISLTRRNSIAKATEEYEKTPGKPFPFEFSAPPPPEFHELHKHLSVVRHDANFLLQHKLPKRYWDLSADPSEQDKPAAEREMSYWVRVTGDSRDDSLRYPGLCIASDSVYLTSLSRIIRLPPDGYGVGEKSRVSRYIFSLSLDHSIYFHDDDFDPCDWLYFTYKAVRFSNNRALYTGSYYNSKGKVFATVIQEGLVFFKKGSEHKAKI